MERGYYVKRILKIVLPLTMSILVIAAVVAQCSCGKADAKEYKIKNAKIYTSDATNLHATAAAVKNGKFVYVGEGGVKILEYTVRRFLI